MRFRGFTLITFLFLFTLSLLNSFAQELGRYPIFNFNHRDYAGHSQNWAIVQDQRGLIYIANNTGVIEYDGSDWRHISINGALSRCLDIDSEGRIWVGGQDEIGYLAADSTTSLKYYSITNKINSGCIPLGLVRQVFATKDGVYFSSNKCLLLVKGDVVKFWKPKTYFHRTFYANGKLYANQPEYGLTYLQNDSLKPLVGTDNLSKKLLYSIQPFNSKKLLLGTQSDGLYLYNLNALRNDTVVIQDSIVTKFKTEVDDFLVQNLIYNSVPLPNSRIAIGTSRGGVVIIDKKGKLIRTINLASNLQDESVWNLFLDNQNNLWMALNNGVSYTNISSPLTFYDDNLGLKGSLQSIVRFNNYLYISSSVGISKKTENGFQEIKDFNKYSNQLALAYSSDNNAFLLAGTVDGIYQIINDKAKRIGQYKNGCYSFTSSKLFPNIVYAGLSDGVGILRFYQGEWVFVGKIEGSKGQVYSLLEDSEGRLWFSNRYKGVSRCNIVNPYQLAADQLKSYDQLPFAPKCDDMSITLIDGSIKVSTDKGLCHYNASTDSFTPDSCLGIEFADGSTGIRILNQDKKGNLWFEAYKTNPNRWLERALKYPDNTYRRIPAQFRVIPDMIFNDVLSEDNDINWIASYDGLYRYDGKIESEKQSIIKLLIRRVTTNNAKQVFNGSLSLPENALGYRSTNFSPTSTSKQKFNSWDNSIIFYFSSPFFGQNQKIKYSFILEGYDNNWSEWSADQKKEYTNLPSGNYKFIVKAKNVFENESPIASYSFTIKRPWYKSPASFILYLLIIAIIIWVYVTVKTNLLKSSNVRLQALVKERTKDLILYQEEIIEKNEELMQQKEEMQVQRDELHEQNRQTAASLEYAKTIQQAILPDLNSLNDIFEHFVLYRPKDVVSGDFYWISRIPAKSKQGEKIFVAVVDCTGHGVPGAFMSMIGSRLLSEIVNEKKIHNPADILSELDNSVNQALRQDVSESFDGMDASICLIEHKIANQYIVTFAGANRMLYFYQSGTNKIQTLRGNRKTIGGIMPDVDPEFLNTRIYLSPDDVIILNSDGITDQNNEQRKKYTASRFHSALLTNIDKPMKTIGEKIAKDFDIFKKNVFQRDDITVLGLRFREEND
ncbi:MAG TPA: hypothetical protein DIW31_11510 [Bacteroidales bacterium]|nr:hypothetical protein [Bacteroidales bacterium]